MNGKSARKLPIRRDLARSSLAPAGAATFGLVVFCEVMGRLIVCVAWRYSHVHRPAMGRADASLRKAVAIEQLLAGEDGRGRAGRAAAHGLIAAIGQSTIPSDADGAEGLEMGEIGIERLEALALSKGQLGGRTIAPCPLGCQHDHPGQPKPQYAEGNARKGMHGLPFGYAGTRSSPHQNISPRTRWAIHSGQRAKTTQMERFVCKGDTSRYCQITGPYEHLPLLTSGSQRSGVVCDVFDLCLYQSLRRRLVA